MKRFFYVVVCGLFIFPACGDGGAPPDDAAEQFEPSGDDELGEEFEPFDISGKGDDFRDLGGQMAFESACEPGDTLTVAAVGDVLLHGRLQVQAFAQDAGYVSLWSGVKDLLEQADVTYANLEGPTAPGVSSSGRSVTDPGRRFDDFVYTSYPMFNYHPSLIDDLLASGVDVVSTSNNHSLDRRRLGADRTIEELERRGLPYTGTRRSDASAEAWWTFTESAGFKLAWLACTYGTNGIPDTDDQVLNCFAHDDEIEQMIAQLAERSDVDAVIVTPHWGQEYRMTPEQRQITLARRFLDAGATAVIGAHPHVLQPWQRYVTKDGRETFVIYSLGNFVSGQRHLPRRTTIILYLGLVRTANGVKIQGVRYVPAHMTRFADGRLSLEAIDRVGDHADSRQLAVDLLGLYNLQHPDQPLVINPQCDPEWVPPHPHDGWIGGACETDAVCGGARCDSNWPEGLCTMPCDNLCPDRAGRSTTFCVDLGNGAGSCVLQCEFNGDCRSGYKCEEMSRFGETSTIRRVCVPEEVQGQGL